MSGTFRALLRVDAAPRARFALSSALGALVVVFGVGLMATAGYLISRAAEHPAILSLMVAIVAVRFFGLGRPVLRYVERLTSHDVALRVLGGVRSTFCERIEPLAPAQLDGYRRGDLLARMVADVDTLQNLYLRGLGPLIVAGLASAVAVAVVVAFLPVAGLVLAAGLLTAALPVPWLSSAIGARSARRQAAARGELSAELLELTHGAPELVVFGATDSRLERVRAADARLVRLARRDALATGIGDAAVLLVTGATVAGVLAVAVNASVHGHLDRVLIAMLTFLALASFEAVAPLGDAARALAATLAAGLRVLELTGQTAVVREPAEPCAPPTWPFAISLEDVRATYPHQARPALDGVTLDLGPGDRVALVGPSGAGKTTIANLLIRFLDPDGGRLLLADRDLRDYRQADVRRLIAVAGQESHLFTASIRDNVRLARPEATDDEIESALRRARIWEWVSGLATGLDTIVGEEGRELSGGQRQRLVLARALLADAPVLVLDEPTAHLDPCTADDLIRDVFSAAADQTVLLITHRTEGLDLVDRVVTLPAN